MSDSDTSSDDLAAELTRFEISSSGQQDETFLSPTSGSFVSSASDEGIPAKSALSKPTKKLNEYLISKGVSPVNQPWMEWDKASYSTKLRYTKRAVEIVSSVLQTLCPKDAGNLWQTIVASPEMHKALDLDELPQTSKDYIQALAEAYDKAHGWETRRQILSIMSGVANYYKAISSFLPGLTRYRYTLANLHRLQYGIGAPVKSLPSRRVRVDQEQLDHFLLFITSPHLDRNPWSSHLASWLKYQM